VPSIEFHKHVRFVSHMAADNKVLIVYTHDDDIIISNGPADTFAHQHTHTHNCFTALWKLSGTTWVSWYQKKHSPTTLIVVINHPYLLSPSTTTHLWMLISLLVALVHMIGCVLSETMAGTKTRCAFHGTVAGTESEMHCCLVLVTVKKICTN